MNEILPPYMPLDPNTTIENPDSTNNFYPLLPIQTNGTESPLFLIHPSSGSALPFKILSDYIKNQPIYGFNNPYFGLYDLPYTSIEEMAKLYIQQIKKLGFKPPYRLGGWSFGGSLAIWLINSKKMMMKLK